MQECTVVPCDHKKAIAKSQQEKLDCGKIRKHKCVKIEKLYF